MKKWIVVVFALVLGIAVFHKAILLASCRLLIYRAQHTLGKGSATYQTIGWEDRKIVVRDLFIKEKGQEIAVDEIALSFIIDWRHLCFCPHIEIIHPQILCESKQEGSSFLLLYRSKRFAPVWSIKHGVFQIREHRFYFSFEQDHEQQSLGSLVVNADLEKDRPPLLKADFFDRKGDLFVEFEGQEKDLYRVSPLLTTFIPGIADLAGSVEIEGSLLIGRDTAFRELTLHSKLEEVSCSFPASDLDFENVKGELDLLFLPAQNRGIELMACAAGGFREQDLVLPIEIVAQGNLAAGEPFSLGGSLKIEHPDHKIGISAFRCLWDGDRNYRLAIQAQEWGKIEANQILKMTNQPIAWTEGVLHGDFTLTFSGEGLQSVAISDAKVHNLKLEIEEQRVLFLKTVEGNALLHPHRKEWLQDCSVKGEEGEYREPNLRISEIGFLFARDQKGFIPSFCQGSWQDLSFTLSYLGREIDPSWQLVAEGDLSPVLSQLLPDKVNRNRAIPFAIKGDIVRSEESLHCVYEGTIFSDRFVASSVCNWPPFSLYDFFAGKISPLAFERGSVQFPSCNLSFYQPFLEELFPKLAFNGLIQAQASLTQDQMEVEWRGRDLLMSFNETHFSLPQIAKAVIRYEKGSNSFSYDIPIHGLSIENPQSFLAIKGLDGDLQGICNIVEKGKWVHKGSLSNLAFPLYGGSSFQQGKVEWSYAPEESFVAKGGGTWSQLDGRELKWELKKLFWDFGEKRQGEFCYRLLEDKREVALLDGTIREVSLHHWECNLHKERSHLAGIVLRAEPIAISEKGFTRFEIRPLFSLEKLPSLLHLIHNTGLLPFVNYANTVQSLELKGEVQTGISWDRMSGEWKVAGLSSAVSVKGSDPALVRFDARVLSDRQLISSLQWGGIGMKAQLSFLSEDRIQISQFQGDWNGVSCRGKGDVKVEPKKLHCSIPALHCVFEQGDLKGTAAASLQFDFATEGGENVTGETHFVSDLSGPVACTISTPRLIRFSYGMREGLVCEGIRLIGKEKGSNSYWGESSVKRFAISPSGLIGCEGVELTLTPQAARKLIDHSLSEGAVSSFSWDGNLKLNGDFKWQKNGYGFQGFINPGWYGWRDRKLFLEQVQVFCDPQGLLVRTKTHVEEQPLWASFQLKFGKEKYGVLKILDHPQAPGLQVTFRSSAKETFLETVDGSVCGLQCHLAREEKKKGQGVHSVVGEIDWDMKRLQLLMPKDLQEQVQKWKLGSGCNWKGEILFFSEGKQPYAFRGRLLGKDFALLGYELKEMKGMIEGNHEKIILSDFEIREGNGSVSMPVCSLKKEKEHWSVEIPFFEVQKLQPSLLKREGGIAGSYKPFMIKQCLLRKVQGMLHDKSSWSGEGSLSFMNQSKKESSLFDFPLEMIKKLGLDLGVVTPVEGEFTLQLAGEKLYFLSLDRSFSEARRSEFYLAPSEEPSYVDLSGNLHIDLRMHQNALFKVVEPFTLTVRGTLEKPRYGLSL